MFNISRISTNKLSYGFFFAFIIFSGISISVSQITLGIAFILFIIASIKDRSLLSPTGLERYILPFIIISFILAFLSPGILDNLLYIKDFWLLSALILAFFLHDSYDRIRKTFYLIVILIIIQSIIAFIQMYFNISFINSHNNIGIFHYSSVDESLRTRGGLLGMHLVFSCYMMLISIPAIYVSIFAGKGSGIKSRLLVITAAIMYVIIFFLIRTRAIIIAIPFAALPLFFINRKLRIWGISVLLSLSLIAGLIFTFYGQDQLALGNKGSILNSVSADQRKIIWKTALEIWKKHPFIGSGGGNYHNEFQNVLKQHPEYDLGKNTHAHNDYLNQLARKGIIGFLAFIYMLYGILKFYIMNLKYINNSFMKSIYLGLFGAYCVFLVASLFQCFYTDEENLVMLWFITGLAGAIVKIEKKSADNPVINT